jgi:hypothetical protein
MKTFARPHLNRKKLDMVAGICHLTYGRKYKIGGSWTRTLLGPGLGKK